MNVQIVWIGIYNEKGGNRKMTEKECEHDWSYASYILTSHPALQDRICRKCGKMERIILSEQLVKNDYDEITRKFKKFE